MRNKIKCILREIVAMRSDVVVDNDFEAAYNFKAINATKEDLTEALYILESVMRENEIDLNKCYDLYKLDKWQAKYEEEHADIEADEMIAKLEHENEQMYRDEE